MDEPQAETARTITPDMTVLDVVSRYRDTLNVFQEYDQAAGVCICCQALFERLDRLAEQYGLDLNKLMRELEKVVPG